MRLALCVRFRIQKTIPMNEQQMEKLEALYHEEFPRGMVVGVIMPNGSLHTWAVSDRAKSDTWQLTEYLAELMRRETARLNVEGEEPEEWWNDEENDDD